jgi:hypothetical protein
MKKAVKNRKTEETSIVILALLRTSDPLAVMQLYRSRSCSVGMKGEIHGT